MFCLAVLRMEEKLLETSVVIVTNKSTAGAEVGTADEIFMAQLVFMSFF